MMPKRLLILSLIALWERNVRLAHPDRALVPVLAENAHPFEDPPLRMNSPFGLFGLTS